MQTNLVEQHYSSGNNGPIESDTNFVKQILEDSYALDQLSSPEVDQELTVAAAARAMGKSARTVQRMLIRGQLKGYKVSGAKGPEWRIQRFQRPVSSESPTCAEKSIDRVALLDARLTEMQKHITELLREQELVRVRAEQVYRQCFEMLHEGKRQQQESTLETKRELKDQSDAVLRQTAQDLQALRERVLNEPMQLTDQQLRAIGNQFRRSSQKKNKNSWWAVIAR